MITTVARAAIGISPIKFEKISKNINTLIPDMTPENLDFAPLTTFPTVLDGEPAEGMHLKNPPIKEANPWLIISLEAFMESPVILLIDFVIEIVSMKPNKAIANPAWRIEENSLKDNFGM
jgi:hypothetical protein